jgi:hypothetical protein
MGLSPSDEVAPNGTDFWWDAFPTNAGNCWWSNLAAPGRSITSSPAWLPNCGGGSNPSASLGLGDLVNELELMGCLAGFQLSGYPAGNPTLCTWAATPPKPETAQASAAERQLLARAQRILGVPQARARLCQLFGNHLAAPC